MAMAYLSDSHLLGAAVRAPGLTGNDVSMMVSLDHTIYYHKQPKADDWLLYCLESPWSGSQRGVVVGKFFNPRGDHIATVIQEGLIRIKDGAEEKLAKI